MSAIRLKIVVRIREYLTTVACLVWRVFQMRNAKERKNERNKTLKIGMLRLNHRIQETECEMCSKWQFKQPITPQLFFKFNLTQRCSSDFRLFFSSNIILLLFCLFKYFVHRLLIAN